MTDKDDFNPMHDIGYGRGDSVERRTKTQTYSVIPPKDPTQKSLTVKDVIARLIEVNLAAWSALPQSMRDALIERPQDFQFLSTAPTNLVHIQYNGVVLRFNSHSWAIDRIV